MMIFHNQNKLHEANMCWILFIFILFLFAIAMSFAAISNRTKKSVLHTLLLLYLIFILLLMTSNNRIWLHKFLFLLITLLLHGISLRRQKKGTHAAQHRMRRKARQGKIKNYHLHVGKLCIITKYAWLFCRLFVCISFFSESKREKCVQKWNEIGKQAAALHSRWRKMAMRRNSETFLLMFRSHILIHCSILQNIIARRCWVEYLKYPIILN